MTDAALLLSRLRARGETLAVAESLTGGLVLAALTAVPGSSRVVRGGVVAYATDVKASVLGVSAELLARGGPVQAAVAEEMARGVAALMSATWGMATTGVAGPGAADGHAAGTVHVAVHGPTGTSSRLLPELADLAAAGADRAGVRDHSVAGVIALTHQVLDGHA